MKKFNEIITVALFALIIFAVPVLTFLSPKNAYSEYENRELQTKPEFSKETLFNGSYFNDWNKYYADHFIMRNEILGSYVNLNMNVLKKPIVNDVTNQDDILLPYLEYGIVRPNLLDNKIEDMTNQIANVNDLAKGYGGKFYFVGVGTQYAIMGDKYPSYLYNGLESINYVDQTFFKKLQEKGVESINLYQDFLKRDNYMDLYSKIDHHYNYYGAYEAYRVIMDRINEQFDVEVLTKDQLEFQDIDLPFLGSRNRKLYKEFESDEKVTIAYPKDPIAFERYDGGDKIQSEVFKIPEEDYATYTVYMDGDKSETVIKTHREELPSILIFGDSFTNPLETLLYYSFDEMRAIDLRTYTPLTITEYIEKHKPDIILYVRDNSVYLNTDGNGNLK